MQDLFGWGEIFLSNLMGLGEWLLHKPLAAADDFFIWVADFLRFYQFEIGPVQLGPSDTVIMFFEMLGSQSVATLIFGGSLIVILTVKFLKFVYGVLKFVA